MQKRAANERLRVLLTGAGSIGRRHAQNLRELVPDAQLSVVSGRAVPLDWAEGLGVNVVPSVEAGLAARPNLAVIASASARHAHDLRLLLDEVDALYVEKPVVVDKADLELLRAKVRSGWDRPTVVGCNLRYLGAIRKLKAACEAGEAGTLARASLQVGQWLPDWRAGRDVRESYSARREEGGGVIFDLVHEIDSACHLFGEIAKGQASAGRSGALPIDSDDAAAITLQMRSGLPVQVTLDYISRQPVREYLVVGDKGTMRLDIVGKMLSLETATGKRLLATDESDWDMAGTYKLAMRDLLDAMGSGSRTYYSLADSLHTTGWMIDLEAGAWRLPKGAAQ